MPQRRGRQVENQMVFAPLSCSDLRKWYDPDLQFLRSQDSTTAGAEGGSDRRTGEYILGHVPT